MKTIEINPMKSAMQFLRQIVSENKGILLVTIVAIVALYLLTAAVILPAFRSSNNKMYGSSLGHPALLRRAGEPLPVKVAVVKEATVKEKIMGEGVCSSQPILVPIIPMAVIKEVYVEEGENVVKGQLLVELHAAKAEIKYESAKLALSTAKAELERVKLGSAYVLAQERPEVEKIKLSSLTKQMELTSDKLSRYQTAYDEGVISEVAFLAVKSEHTIAFEELRRAQLSMMMAEEGVKQSLKIAQNSTEDARLALAHRAVELEVYKVFSPADGVIDRVLVNGGEYNQDSGKPGFVISSGLWFDAYFDQAEYGRVKKGQTAVLSIESRPGHDFKAIVTMVKPVVSFNSGGPEISRPLRPRGSGSPEWAATFKVSLEIEDSSEFVTGMTGFARIEQIHGAMTVPRGAVTSVSAGKALVYVVSDNNEWETREVRIGQVNTELVEVIDGLIVGERVMTEGHWNLRSDDKITIHP